MIAKAETKFLRISPTKVRQVIELIRGQDVNSALAHLSLINKRSKFYLEKILKAAIANAKTKGFKEEELYVSKIVANVGPMWKRYKAASFGRAVMIRKRTSHVKIELDLKNKS